MGDDGQQVGRSTNPEMPMIPPPCIHHSKLEQLVVSFVEKVGSLEKLMLKIDEALRGGYGSGPGVVDQVRDHEIRLKKIEDDRDWFRRTLISALVGVILALVVSAIAILK